MPLEYYKGIQVKTIQEAIKSKTPTLSVIRKELIANDPERGELQAKAFITKIITDLVMYFNVGKTMNAQQVVEVVDFIQRDYYFLTPAKLRFCFDNAKMGKYAEKGKPVLYDAIDGSIIFGWIDRYLDDELSITLHERQMEHEDIKRNGTGDEAALLSIFKGIDFGPSEEKSKSDTSVWKRDYNEQDALIQDLFKEFEKEYKSNPLGEDSGIRFIMYKTMVMSQNEYVDFRLSEFSDKR